MWCLWNLGILGEPLIGPYGMVAVYMITGIAGNLLSMAWNVVFALRTHDASYLMQVGAGASGAVFGIAGILIVLLSNRRLPFPWEELRRLRSMVVKFALINLVIGLSTIFVNVGIRIDNIGPHRRLRERPGAGRSAGAAHDGRPRTLPRPPEGHLRRGLPRPGPLRLLRSQTCCKAVVSCGFPLFVVRDNNCRSSDRMSLVFNEQRELTTVNV